MKNTNNVSVQMPEETYQRMKDYLKRHQVKQKDFLIGLLDAAMSNSGTNESESKEGRQI